MESRWRLTAMVPLFLATVILGGCASGNEPMGDAVGANTEPAVIFEETEPVKPERVASATPSAAPTSPPTPTAALAAGAYYLAYARDVEGGAELVVANPEGEGRRGYPVPVELKGMPLALKGVSPGGEYFAYHSGDLDETRSDLTLHVMRLADEEEVFSARLITEDVGEQLQALGEELVTAPPEQLLNVYLDGMTAADFAGEGWSALEAGIRAVDWSPDGRVLAFAGQIAGPTSDVYTYDVTTGKVRRLTDGPSQVQYVDWSPDGRWIAHGSAYWVGMGTYMINNFVSRDGARVTSMDVGGQYENQWYGSDWYLTNNGANGPGDIGLQMISPELGEVRMLWEPSFSGYALDLEKGLLLVSQLELAGGESAGTYLVDVEEGSKERLGGPADWVRRWRRQGELGLMPSSNGVLAVDASGASRLLLEGEYGFPDPSPSGDKIAFYWYGDVEGLRVLDVAGGDKMTLDVPGVTCVSWRPDEEALAFLADDALYFNDLQGKASMLVDAEPQRSYLDFGECGVVWIEGNGE